LIGGGTILSLSWQRGRTRGRVNALTVETVLAGVETGPGPRLNLRATALALALVARVAPEGLGLWVGGRGREAHRASGEALACRRQRRTWYFAPNPIISPAASAWASGEDVTLRLGAAGVAKPRSAPIMGPILSPATESA
jgi:hypothetical protein